MEGTADVYSPKVIRSTMGSIFRQNIIYCNFNEKEEFVKFLKENGYTLFSTVLEKSDYIENIKFDKKNVFIFGNEANGVCEFFKEVSDRNIKIRMSNKTDSLNVSVAAGIVMYKHYIENYK